MQIIGNGFLARNLAEHLSDRHPHVTAIAAGVSWTHSRSLEDFDREAALLTDTVAEHLHSGRTIVFFSTAAGGMYGNRLSTGTECGPVFPRTAYARHKLALESMLARSGMRWLILRLTHVVGHGQPRHQLLPALTEQVRSGRVTLYRGAHRDLLDVRDLGWLIDRLLVKGVHDEVINVASGTPEPVERIVEAIEARLGTVAEKAVVDRPAQNGPLRIARLRELVPEIDERGFERDYLTQLITRYVPAGTNRTRKGT
ncbi:NAD-dependent epimerase/dehydratase family protein [Goodfellowiella coeruleoviolacea]|uniref:Nucleoside-diphosphate-sugar epimerase n=1 Tax=Goodfellowiella coeruleoviolacea TaxID=334858 RepID=A0AAE3KK34_9PSEU|nr:NAD-dependent epimerase/dehydratase family protein [Goodfellowiella coeruleoviolacea]MCP2170270.1 Nucleoside-diphosphate-sugar epimerase [Goodfellowiella coeruleoviolacea]